VGYSLTVYGKGGQTRGYLDIRDTLQCVRLSIENPAKAGELRIFNQFVETFSVNELADRVKKTARDFSLNVTVKQIENPRKEAEEHYYNPAHTGLLELGLQPHYLTDEVISNMIKCVMRYKATINEDIIFKGVKW
jgi:UDP-sulfoquinovose synthase